jgi:hypothetical protein
MPGETAKARSSGRLRELKEEALRMEEEELQVEAEIRRLEEHPLSLEGDSSKSKPEGIAVGLGRPVAPNQSVDDVQTMPYKKDKSVSKVQTVSYKDK